MYGRLGARVYPKTSDTLTSLFARAKVVMEEKELMQAINQAWELLRKLNDIMRFLVKQY